MCTYFFCSNLSWLCVLTMSLGLMTSLSPVDRVIYVVKWIPHTQTRTSLTRLVTLYSCQAHGAKNSDFMTSDGLIMNFSLSFF